MSARPAPSDNFIRLDRNPDLEPPAKVVRTVKRPGDVVIGGFGRGEAEKQGRQG